MDIPVEIYWRSGKLDTGILGHGYRLIAWLQFHQRLRDCQGQSRFAVRGRFYYYTITDTLLWIIKRYPVSGFTVQNSLEYSDKDETMVKYSVLQESQQIFASKYMTVLPTVEELQRELERNQLIYNQKWLEYT